jgi:hypothetical protein
MVEKSNGASLITLFPGIGLRVDLIRWFLSVLFDLGRVMFGGEHFFFGAAPAPPFLAADSFHGLAFGAGGAQNFFFHFFGQTLAGAETVHGLGAFFLASDRRSGGNVDEDDTTGHLVDVLTAGPAGADKPLFQIGFMNAQRDQAIL